MHRAGTNANVRQLVFYNHILACVVELIIRAVILIFLWQQKKHAMCVIGLPSLNFLDHIFQTWLEGFGCNSVKSIHNGCGFNIICSWICLCWNNKWSRWHITCHYFLAKLRDSCEPWLVWWGHNGQQAERRRVDI